ncbi:MAG: DUF1295 domain-containing protein [Beijerinckiaceae bacterium]|jgi:steroid 5-alpha reductase family enzyme|nr:DUF1295 domain-containing protein [Beijerinckiaceae bacterium]
MTAGIFILISVLVAMFMAAGMTLAWIVQQRSGQSGWVDVCWTFCTGIAGAAAALGALFIHPDALRPLIVALFAGVWSLRLGMHIIGRTRGAGDDPRYAKMRADWGDDAPRRMFVLLQVQALVSVPLVLAIVLAAWNVERPLGFQDAFAALVLVLAITGEGIADAQLRRFAKNPANHGQICKTGLWRWSRHPNYFFEWLVWLAYPIFAINLDLSYGWGLLTLGAPVCMYWLLTRVSGVPLLEDHMVRKHGDRYRDYQSTTSAFFPMPPTY